MPAPPALDPEASQPPVTRRTSISIYEEARPALGNALAVDPAGERVTAALRTIHTAIRDADVTYRHEQWERSAPEYEPLVAAWHDEARRTNRMVAAYRNNERKLGRERAKSAAQAQYEAAVKGKYLRAHPPHMPVTLWENMVGDALIWALSHELGRNLRFATAVDGSGYYGVDLNLLSMLFDAAMSFRARRDGSQVQQDLMRGNRVRAPGTPSWFAHRLRHWRGILAP